MNLKLAVAAVLCAVTLAFAPTAEACWTTELNVGWNASEPDALNRNFNDFGAIFLDSHPHAVNCGATAASALKRKLRAMPDSAFRGFLAGANVSLAFAAAMQLGPRGFVDAELDAELARAGRLYVMDLDPTNGGCGFDNGQWARGNTCQEDRLIGAAAYAWIGAYYRKSGRPWSMHRTNAITQIQQALSNADSVCHHNPNLPFDPSRGPCNGATTDPIVSLNHSSQSPAYGLGQISSMSVALIGLDAMDAPWSNASLSTYQQSVLASMWTEGSSKARPTDGVFENECYDVNNWMEPPTNACNDMHFGGIYEAYRFPVWYAFQRYNLPGRSAGGYQWQLSNGTYELGNREAFFGAARYAYYHILTKAYNDVYEPDYGWPRPAAFHGGADYYMGMKLGTTYWASAANNGGSTISANVTAQNSWESFYLNDRNGGELRSGDPVSIRTTTGWYWSATNGGGSTLNANVLSAITWEVFTIEKRGGSTGTRIHDNDTFVLKTYNGTHYVNGVAGGQLSASGTSTSAAVLRFKHVVDY